LPERALTFLRAVGTSPVIRTIMAAHGYTQQEHDLGWKLLQQVSGYTPPAPGPASGLGLDADPAVRDAIARLDEWDEPNFEWIEAALKRAFPQVAEFVFNNLKPGEGAEAVVSVATLLARLEALDSAKEREATRKQDHAALKLLEARGLTKKVRESLAADVATAKKGTQATVVLDPSAKDEQAEEQHQTAQADLYAWYKDWTATARTHITRRDYLIRLGLANRKKPEKKG